MNIFVTSPNPHLSAIWHCDKHCIKQITESSQILSCALIRHNCPTEALPLTKKGTPVKGGYHHHPCSKWAGDSMANFVWLAIMADHLCTEYTKRYGKTHFCEKGIKQMLGLSSYIPSNGRTPFPVAISEDKNCRNVVDNFDELDIYTKYRLYIKLDKPFAVWKANRPKWMDQTVGEITYETGL